MEKSCPQKGLNAQIKFADAPLLSVSPDDLAEADAETEPDEIYSCDGMTLFYVASKFVYENMLMGMATTVGINLNAADQLGRTALSQACRRGHTGVVKLLLSMKNDHVDAHDQGDLTPPTHASRGGHMDMAKPPAPTIVDVNRSDQNGMTPLHWASWMGYEDIMNLMLGTVNVHTDTRDCYEMTPLMHASRGGNLGVVKILLTLENVDANAVDPGGETLLMWASLMGHEEVVGFFLARKMPM